MNGAFRWRVASEEEDSVFWEGDESNYSLRRGRERVLVVGGFPFPESAPLFIFPARSVEEERFDLSLHGGDE